VGVDDKIITTKGAPDEGMVIDFGDLKAVMMKEIDERFDHGFIVYEGDEFLMSLFDIPIWTKSSMNIPMSKLPLDPSTVFSTMKVLVVDYIPTAENLARDTYRRLAGVLELKYGISLAYVKVWETPNSSAVFTSQDVDKEEE